MFLIDTDVSVGKTTDCFAYLAITDEGRHETTTIQGNGARGYALFMNEVEFNKASNRKTSETTCGDVELSFLFKSCAMSVDIAPCRWQFLILS